MKIKALLILPFILFSTPSLAQSVRVYEESYCYQTFEEYIPGYYNRYGQYVGGFVKTKEVRVPCRQVYVNSCLEPRGIIGGLLRDLFGCY